MRHRSNATRLWLLIGLALLPIGCRPIRETDPDKKVTITQGLYGLATKPSGIDASPVYAWWGARFEVYAECPGGGYDPDNPVIASGVSDPNGFYQIALEPGDYIVCAEFRRCTAVTVDPNARQRLDYDSTDGHGWSNTGVPAPCP